MPLVILALGIALLLVLMLWIKLDSFTSLLVTAVVVALALTMPLGDIVKTLKAGVGSMSGTTLIVLLGGMLGVLLADMGVAGRLADTLVKRFGIDRVPLAIIVVAFLVGVVMFYEAAFVILIPIVFTIVREAKKPLLWLALPMSIMLSAMHSFLPPHPGPVAVAGVMGASVGKTLLIGLPIALVFGTGVALVWPHLSVVKNNHATIPSGLVAEHEFKDEDAPSFMSSLALTILPIVLIGGAAIVEALPGDGDESTFRSVVEFIGDAPIALLVSVLVSIAYFNWRRRIPMPSILKACQGGLKSVAMIVFIILAGGAFKQVLVEGGISDYVMQITSGWNLSPIVLAWLVAVIMRLALGSASVASVAAAGIAVPLVQASGVSPEIMVLAVTCGSIFCSHVNDPGFWMFKEYLNLSVVDTFKVRSTYTTVLSVLGLGGVLVMNALITA